VASDGRGLEIELLAHYGQGSQAGDDHGWLSDLSLGQPLERAFGAELRNRPAGDRVGQFEQAPRGQGLLAQVGAHAHGLRGLAREKQR
jgi:hypothetical protein